MCLICWWKCFVKMYIVVSICFNVICDCKMIPSGPMLVQQQTSSGLQLILRSPPPNHSKQSTVVLSNGGLASQGTVVFQGRQQAQPVCLSLLLLPHHCNKSFIWWFNWGFCRQRTVATVWLYFIQGGHPTGKTENKPVISTTGDNLGVLI